MNVIYPLIQISEVEMRRILRADKDKGAEVVGYPMYVSPSRRVYPEPSADIEVHFDGEFPYFTRVKTDIPPLMSVASARLLEDVRPTIHEEQRCTCGCNRSDRAYVDMLRAGTACHYVSLRKPRLVESDIMSAIRDGARGS